MQATGRITPAGAGKTGISKGVCPKAEDHPRRCGENHRRVVCRNAFQGSPPQVRGKLLLYVNIYLTYRITPAGAGKTLFLHFFKLDIGDHPRRCGENDKNMYYEIGKAGSPPQVRGKLEKKAQLSAEYRITPAGAGKTT